MRIRDIPIAEVMPVQIPVRRGSMSLPIAAHDRISVMIRRTARRPVAIDETIPALAMPKVDVAEKLGPS